MKKRFEFLAILVFFFVIILSFLLNNNFNSDFNKLTIVENKTSELSNINVSVPEKLELWTSYCGVTTIQNKTEISNIITSIKNITNNKNSAKTLETPNSTSTIYGNIYYSDGHVDKFSLNNVLNFNKTIYNTNSYILNLLHEKLYTYFSNFDYFLKILSSSDSSISILNNKTNTYMELSENTKMKILNNLNNLSPIQNPQDLLYTNVKNKSLYHFAIYMKKSYKNTTDNIIYMDVYKNYIVIQFLGDDTGKKIFIEGGLNEKDF